SIPSDPGHGQKKKKNVAAFTHCVWHSGTRRINHGDETQEAELLGGKVGVVAVEGEPSGELGRRQVQVAEACKTSGGISEVVVHY
uniref:Uncharacterized protein n=1 Tax=Scophthalmus maximus TaxID=52904 RepID=A0A8D3AB19_SCOMX